MIDALNALKGYQEFDNADAYRQAALALQQQAGGRADRSFAWEQQRAARQDALEREKMRLAGTKMAAELGLEREKLNKPVWDPEWSTWRTPPGAGGGTQVAQAGGGMQELLKDLPPGISPRAWMEAKKAGLVQEQKDRATARLGLPQQEAATDQVVSYIEGMVGNPKTGKKEHPGFRNAVGFPEWGGLGYVANLWPGSSTNDFKARLEQVQGGAFLQAFETLKGGGQITEIEGKKATAAITRMQMSQSEKEFIEAANEFKDVVINALAKARKKAGVTSGGGGLPAGWKVLGVEGGQ